MSSTVSTDSLALIDGARAALEQARTLSDIGAIRDVAERARRYASAAKLGRAAINHATRLRVDAERKAGQLLEEMDRQRQSDGRPKVYSESTHKPPRLPDLGVTRKQASEWTTMARMPDTAYRRHLDEKIAADEPITTKGVVREARKIEQKESAALLEQLPDPGDAHRRARIKRAYSSAVLQVMQGFMTIDAAITIEVLDHDERNDFYRFAASLRSRLDAWETAMQQGLHVVGG